IRLLGRVLELERDQKQAKQMLSRLRTRERAAKRLMAGGAALLATAAVSGGAVLLYMTPPTEESMRARDEGPPGRVVPSTSIKLPEQREARPGDPPGATGELSPDPRSADTPVPRKTVSVRPGDPTR